MEPQNPYAAPQIDEQSIPESPLGHYVPLQGRANWVAVAIAVSLVFGTLAAIFPASDLNLADDGAPMAPGDIVEILYVVAAAAAVVMVCFFLPQANRNARVLADGIQFTPGATIWWFFVPILNLIRPYQAVSELWNSSEPLTTVRWKFGETPSILPIWWGAWIVSAVFEQFESRLGAADGVSLIFDYVAGGAFIVILRGLAARQAQRKNALEAVGLLPSAFSPSISR